MRSTSTPLCWVLQAMALSAVLCFAVVALIVTATPAISGRPFTQFGPLVLDLGIAAAALLLVAAAATVLPMIWLIRTRAWRSSSRALGCGVLTGSMAFAIRYYLLRHPTENPGTASAYITFLWNNPWELAGVGPFMAGGVLFAVYWQRPRSSRNSRRARRLAR